MQADSTVAETASQLTLPLRFGAHSHTSHAPPPTAAALRSLLMLEIKFAALRDRLYIERMEEAAEEEMIHDGTHPALTYLYKTLAGRREKLHEVASRRHQQTLEELVKAREAEKDAVWTWWTVSSSARASVSLLRLVAGSDVVQQGPSCVGALTR
jgi:hypothetical protein